MRLKLVMPETNIKVVCEDLNKYLMLRYKYKKSPARFNQFTISAYRVQFDIYLRFNHSYWGENTLVIARLGFKETQKDYGTDLLKFFINIADQHQIERIGLESTNDNSIQFAKKLGFSKIDARNYVITIKQLKLSMKNKKASKL